MIRAVLTEPAEEMYITKSEVSTCRIIIDSWQNKVIKITMKNGESFKVMHSDLIERALTKED